MLGLTDLLRGYSSSTCPSCSGGGGHNGSSCDFVTSGSMLDASVFTALSNKVIMHVSIHTRYVSD